VEIKESLYDIQESLRAIKPELMIIIGLIASITLSFFRKVKPEIPLLFGAAVSLLCVYLIIDDWDHGTALFGGMLENSSFAGYFKVFVSMSALVTFLLTLAAKQQLNKTSEYVTLVLAIVLGGNLLVMSNHMLLIFLSIELISIPSYILAGFTFSKPSSEGSLKYFLYGAVASATMLYGFTLIYGFTGSLLFSSTMVFPVIENPLVALVGCFMIFSGLFFKLAAAPMHFWAPDVYESAPTPVVALLSTAPKLAVIPVVLKITTAFENSPGIISSHDLVAIVSILSITVGNFGALTQQNPKRMMAYSSIAQSGFMLIGIVSAGTAGPSFLLFYAAIYTISNFLVFAYLVYFEHNGISTVTGFSGSGFRHFFASLLLLIGLISLTGLPPTAGFTAKLFIFSALWETVQQSGNNLLMILFVAGLMNTVVSLFYYLKIPYYSFLKHGQTIEKQNFITLLNLLGLLLVLVILGCFFIPGILMGWINKVTFVF